ncbi:hypothetical protein BDA96_09G119000 [Sorghum bicolor]|uniref:Uncharacterized protein n=1 Tax=Sorghum bicolor TaxID=4558 RepID=A0A921U4A5_SORBI|nr:hypothetical protein BDA96_09G119000 [Sorghum bicolor]
MRRRRPSRRGGREPTASAAVAGHRGRAPGVGVLDAEPRAGEQAPGQPLPRRPALPLRLAGVRARRGAAQVHGLPRRVPQLRPLPGAARAQGHAPPHRRRRVRLLRLQGGLGPLLRLLPPRFLRLPRRRRARRARLRLRERPRRGRLDRTPALLLILEWPCHSD